MPLVRAAPEQELRAGAGGDAAQQLRGRGRRPRRSPRRRRWRAEARSASAPWAGAARDFSAQRMKAVFAGGSSSSFKRAFLGLPVHYARVSEDEDLPAPLVGHDLRVGDEAAHLVDRHLAPLAALRVEPGGDEDDVRVVPGQRLAGRPGSGPQGRSTPSASQSMAAASVRARPSRASSFMEAAIYAWASSVPPCILNASISFILPFRGGGGQQYLRRYLLSRAAL